MIGVSAMSRKSANKTASNDDHHAKPPEERQRGADHARWEHDELKRDVAEDVAQTQLHEEKAGEHSRDQPGDGRQAAARTRRRARPRPVRPKRRTRGRREVNHVGEDADAAAVVVTGE